MTDGTGHITQVRFVGITVLKVFRFRLLDQFLHGAVTGQAAVVLHRIICFGQTLTMTTGATNAPFGMEMIHKL